MRVLAIGAHPDDLEIGMGGTIARYSKDNEVTMVIAVIPNLKEIRLNEAENAARFLGSRLMILDLDPNKLVFSRDIVRIFDKVIKENRPDVVYTHWNHDSHQDHNAVSNAVIASTRKNNCTVYMYEQTLPGGIVPFSFRAQSFVDISKFFDKKMESLQYHKSQTERNNEFWLPGVKGRAMYRGNQINVEYAEAFELVKEIKY